MPKNLMLIAISIVSNAAFGAMWTEVTDDRRPNCANDSCVIRAGDVKFKVEMTVVPKDGLEYLERLVIKEMATGRTQEFDTSSVSATESHRPFHLYAVHLQNPKTRDLALYAFDSAKAGPAYYYFVYDAGRREFVSSERTLAKLVWNAKAKTLETEIQETPYRIENFKLVATGEPM